MAFKNRIFTLKNGFTAIFLGLVFWGGKPKAETSKEQQMPIFGINVFILVMKTIIFKPKLKPKI